tara:strand:- start:4312 stop:5499 length:1188 start_codon:yes stop_codon:yes gene_type:complete
MNFIKKANFTGFLFATFLLLSLSFTVLYKYVLFNHGIHLKYTWLPDIIFFAIINAILIYKRNYFLILITILLLLIKSLGSFFVFDFYENRLDYFKEVIKTVFSFSMVFFIYTYVKNINLSNIVFIFKVFNYVSVIISASIILGFIFNISFFETYTGVRFGFSGFLFPQSFSSYFIIVSILIYYYYNKNIKKISSIYIVFTILSAFLIGTKAVYIFLFFFIAMFFINNKLYKNKVAILFSSLVFTILLFNYKALKEYMLDKFSVLYNVYNESGLLTFLFSYRDLSFLKAKFYVQNNWNITNYLFGGINRKAMLVEMELVDIFLSFGILGSVFLLLCYYKIILKPVAFKRDSFFLYSVLFFIILMSGNFFKSFTINYFIVFSFVILTYKPKVFTEND